MFLINQAMVDVPIGTAALIVVLGICHSTFQELEHGLTSGLVGHHQVSVCGLYVLAPDHVADETHLTGRHPDIFHMC